MRWMTLKRWRLVLALFGLLLVTDSPWAQGKAPEFDHLRTGYALTGAHAAQPCESCHINGIFKGTPRECDTCHVSGTRFSRANVVRSAQHLPTTQTCDACHTTKTFIGARFNHAGVTPGTCQSCHNGNLAPGKPADHIATQAACDSCHRSSAWRPVAKLDHAAFNASTNCSSCHNGSSATGMPAQHMPTSGANCSSCHNVSPAGWRPTKWNHTQVTVVAQCATCHSGGYPPADGKVANHIPYASVPAAAAANCDACHKAGYTTWSGGKLHAYVSISTGCATCHNGAYLNATGKPGTAIHTTATVCESCHTSTTDWGSAKIDHSTFNASTNCASCHNGSAASGKSATHMPVGSTSCYSCHNVSPSAWKPTKWNHTQVAVVAQCATCHSGGYPPADGKVANHIPYASVPAAAAANCDACHKAGYTTWSGGKLHAYVSVSTGCATCHTGSYLNAVGKPTTALHAGVTVCESCHKSTTAWSSVSFAHTPANAVGTGTCDTCHNGSTALGKPASHILVPAGVAKCDSCHKSQASFAAATTMNHTVVTTVQCKTCHNGSYVSQGTQGALAKPTNHIPEAQLLNGAAMDCNACHTGTASWTSTTMNHNNSPGSGAGWCKACHTTGTTYLGSMERKALTHQQKNPVPVDCSQSGCHRPLGNKGSAYRNWD
jgi:hypothetical protein